MIVSQGEFRMRLVKTLFLCLVCLGWAWAQPKVVLESDRFDFGPIPQGVRLVHRFALANGGDAPLEIQRLDAACGCTTAVVGRSTLAPGERTELEVALATGGLRGPVHKTVEVTTTDPAQPRWTLHLQAEVQAEILLTSDEVTLLDLAPAQRRKATVHVRSGTGQPITVADVDLSPAPWLGVATREAGQELYVDLDLVARRLPKDRSAGTDTITLHLANPKPVLVTLKVNWAKLPQVTAEPPRVAWAEPAGQERSMLVSVHRRDRRPFRILAARTTSPLLRAENLTPGAAPAHQVRVVLDGAAVPGAYNEKVTLDLDVAGQLQLEVRVSAVLR
jgi:hypothetical protein